MIVLRTVRQDLDDSIRRFVQRGVVRRLARFYDRPDAALTVELLGRAIPRRDNQPQCRLTLVMPGGRTQHVEQAAEELREAVDRAGVRLERRVKRELSRLRERNPHRWRRRPRTAIRVPNSALPPNVAMFS